jgi:hypothetical protein
VKTSGHRDLADKIKRFGNLGREAFAAAAFRWATNVVSTAMRITPYDTGWLRGSRYVQKPDVTGAGAFTVQMGFSAEYAVFVHEINKRYTVGEFKFFEKALMHHSGSAMREIGAWTDAFIKAGGAPSMQSPHPTEPVQGTRPKSSLARKEGETPKKHRARVIKAQALKAKSRAANERRMADELAATIAGMNPRPGRGGR